MKGSEREYSRIFTKEVASKKKYKRIGGILKKIGKEEKFATVLLFQVEFTFI